MSTTATATRSHWTAERKFFAGMAAAILVAVYVGFARSFFLHPWFPDFPAPRERFFLLHGSVFTAWCLLFVTQVSLVSARRVDLHRRIGAWGAGLAALMVVLGVTGALIAAHRATGFTGLPVPPLQFLLVPLTDMVLFATFVTLAVLKRRDPQAHKRWMLLATFNLLAAAFARWPGVSDAKNPLMFFGLADLFVVALVAWDVVSLRRVHTATRWGGTAFVLSQPLRLALSGTPAWLSFAAWAVSLLG